MKGPSPKSLAELAPFLEANPKVLITNLDGSQEELVFNGVADNGLWFTRPNTDESYLPIDCRLTDAAAKAESGVSLDDAGFTLTKFGHSIRVEYLA